jgi:D-proline reductase (dithiol) PrdB
MPFRSGTLAGGMPRRCTHRQKGKVIQVIGTEWVLSDAERQKFDTWMATIMRVHTDTTNICNHQLHWTPLTKPLSACVVTLCTTGGVHRKSDQPFDLENPHGDWTWREIPTDIVTAELIVTHSHYSHVDADRDINCMFPLDRLRELCAQGVIGGIVASAYSMMGFNPDPAHLMEHTALELVRRYKDGGADIVFMTCG